MTACAQICTHHIMMSTVMTLNLLWASLTILSSTRWLSARKMRVRHNARRRSSSFSTLGAGSQLGRTRDTQHGQRARFGQEQAGRGTDPSLRYVLCSSASSVSRWTDDMGDVGSVLSDEDVLGPSPGLV